MQDGGNPWPVPAYLAALASTPLALWIAGLLDDRRAEYHRNDPAILFLFLTFGAIFALLPFGLTRLASWRFGLNGLLFEVVAGVFTCLSAWILASLLFGQRMGILASLLFGQRMGWMRGEFHFLALMGAGAGLVYWAVGAIGRSWNRMQRADRRSGNGDDW